MGLDIVVDGQSIWLPYVALLGVSVGLVAGMFGVGGGFLMVPALHIALGVPLPYAVGAALCQGIAVSLGGMIRYRGMGHAESRFDLMLLGGSLLGVDAGARLLAALERGPIIVLGGAELPVVRVVVVGLYVVLFGVISALLWFKPAPTAEHPVGPGPLARLRLGPGASLPVAGLPSVSGILVAYIGFGCGALAGLIGIGGGVLLIPVMLYGFGFDIRKTAGTGLIVVLCVTVWGTLRHSWLGHVHLGLALPIMIGSALAAQVGAGLTRSLPAQALRRALAVVLVLAVGALLVKLLSAG